MPDAIGDRRIKVVCPECADVTVYVLDDPQTWIGRVARFICPTCLVSVRWWVTDAPPQVRGRLFASTGPGCWRGAIGESRLSVSDQDPPRDSGGDGEVPPPAVSDISAASLEDENLRTVRVRRGYRGVIEPIDPDFEWGRPRAEGRSAAFRSSSTSNQAASSSS